MKVSVVIPNWDGQEVLAPCLDALKQSSLKHEVIVVDNGSVDGSVAMLKKDYPWVRIIENDRNYGFAGGVNRGIVPAIDGGADYIALLNNDALVTKNWLNELVECAEKHSETGIVTCKFMRLDKKHLDSTGEYMTIWGLPFPRGRNEVDTGQYDKIEPAGQRLIFGATGGATLYRTSMLKQIGLFDEDFFAYFEDVDISFRAQMAGWKVLYEPRAIAYHHVSATSSRLGDFARFHTIKNFLLLYAKNMPLKLYLKYGPLFAAQYVRMAVGSLIAGKFWVFVRGTLAAFRLHFSTVKKRRAIQQSRTVPVAYIDSILWHHRPPKPPAL